MSVAQNCGSVKLVPCIHQSSAAPNSGALQKFTSNASRAPMRG